MLVTKATETGRRDYNEDAALVEQDDRGAFLFVVADGMGGAAGGDVASRIACDVAAKAWRACEAAEPALRLVDAYEAANREVRAEVERVPGLRGMGTTLVSVSVVPNDGRGVVRAAVGNVGDSRCYGVRSGRLQRLTQDHSVVEEAIRAGQMTRAEAELSPARNVVTRAVGTKAEVLPDVVGVRLLAGDVLLLCSDGLHGALPDAEIGNMLADPAVRAQHLVDAALLAGASDNVTAILVRF
jgi:protein phosphatase